jgi:hypothetical protein
VSAADVQNAHARRELGAIDDEIPGRSTPLGFVTVPFAVGRRNPRIAPLLFDFALLCERWTLLVVRGVIQRTRPHGPAKKGTGSAEYDLTPAGRDLAGVLEPMAAWGHRWAVADLRREDMEPSYLMWLAHRSIRTEEMGPGRLAIAYHLLDAPGNQRLWWIVIDDGEADLCFKHPGFAGAAQTQRPRAAR